MLEALIQFVAELAFQVVVELLAEVGLRPLKALFDKASPPWLAALGYALLGGALGGLSLWLLPQPLMQGEIGRIAVLILVPILAGLLMAAVGAWRARRGQVLLRIDRFSYGYLFALAFALVRHVFAS